MELSLEVGKLGNKTARSSLLTFYSLATILIWELGGGYIIEVYTGEDTFPRGPAQFLFLQLLISLGQVEALPPCSCVNSDGVCLLPVLN